MDYTLILKIIFTWTVSIIVLSWLSLEPAHLETFIGNRVSQIQQLTDVDRGSHVPSQKNPADIISRRQESKFHWSHMVDVTDPPEKRTPKIQVIVMFPHQNVFKGFSTSLKFTGSLTVEEMNF